MLVVCPYFANGVLIWKPCIQEKLMWPGFFTARAYKIENPFLFSPSAPPIWYRMTKSPILVNLF